MRSTEVDRECRFDRFVVVLCWRRKHRELCAPRSRRRGRRRGRRWALLWAASSASRIFPFYETFPEASRYSGRPPQAQDESSAMDIQISPCEYELPYRNVQPTREDQMIYAGRSLCQCVLLLRMQTLLFVIYNRKNSNSFAEKRDGDSESGTGDSGAPPVAPNGFNIPDNQLPL